MNPNIENKLEERLILCSKCNKPLAKIKGNKIYIKKYNKGKPVYVRIDIKHDAGGQFKIICEECGENHFFARNVKTLGMTYAIKKQNVNKRT